MGRDEQWDDDMLVRPYTITGGRTRPRTPLELETIVNAVERPLSDPAALPPELHSIYTLCREWRSVAEISAMLRLPLGVTRVLVADLAHEDLLRLHHSNVTEGPTDLRLLERVLHGLRKL